MLEVYRPPIESLDCRTIVDLGANLGFATLYFASRFPHARIYSFEPHPEHCRLFADNVRINGLSHRVQIIKAAAGISKGSAHLTDANRESAVHEAAGEHTVPVAIVDIFEQLAGLQAIDLLKMDIEGGEYPILGDDRFAELKVRQLVMEWHRTPAYSDCRAWCRDRLQSLGFVLEEREDAGEYGTIAAYHRERQLQGPLADSGQSLPHS
jgi:FkbM family methyltransferase